MIRHLMHALRWGFHFTTLLRIANKVLRVADHLNKPRNRHQRILIHALHLPFGDGCSHQYAIGLIGQIGQLFVKSNSAAYGA